MDNDPWLEKWLPSLKLKSTNGLVLELGCGWGWDTFELLDAGCKVVASDRSTENLSVTRSTAPRADTVQLDHSRSLPFVDCSIDVILASLTLHYFPWTVTLQIASELKRCLKPDGILLARFNSTHDVNYGAGSGVEIEPNFYQMETITKRFFDEASVRSLLQNWDVQFLQENVIYRFEKPKSVWEVMAVCN